MKKRTGIGIEDKNWEGIGDNDGKGEEVPSYKNRKKLLAFTDGIQKQSYERSKKRLKLGI